MEGLKKAWEALYESIKSCGHAGVNGTRVAELKELADKMDKELKTFEE